MSGCYDITYIRFTTGVQKPKKPDASIRNWRTRCEVYRCSRSEIAMSEAAAERDRYNGHSIEQRWRTWAVVMCDSELRRIQAVTKKLNEHSKSVIGYNAPTIHVHRGVGERPVRFHAYFDGRGDIGSIENLAGDVIADVRAVIDEWQTVIDPQPDQRPRPKQRRAV